MGGGGEKTTTQQINKVELPPWVDQASQSNYQLAQQVANRPLNQYQGDRVAAPSAITNQGYGLLQNTIGQNNPLFQQAADVYGRTTNPLDISSYLNPYTSEVENRAIANANTSLAQQLAGNASAAQKAGAFGGSRFGVQQGVTQAQGVKGIGDLSAQLRQQGFDTATQAAISDRSGMQAGAAGLLNTASGRGAQNTQDISSLLAAGQSEQGSRQKVIDAAMQKFQEAQNYPIEQLNLRLAALGMSPYGKTEMGNKTSETESSPDWATVGLGALKALPGVFGLFSDRNAKTDIKKLTDGDIPLYSYRYKGDPKSYPKVVGPMAQDIEKKYPSAIKNVGKHRVVDLNNLMEVLS